MRNNTIVFVIAVTDIIIAMLLIVYNALQVAIVWSEFGFADARLTQVLPITIPSWAFSFSVNLMQIYVATQLLKVATVRREFDARYFLENTKFWLRASSFIDLILIVKLCLVLLVKPALQPLRDMILIYFWFGSILLILCEIVFRLIAVHYVRRFIDKLPNVRRIDVHSLYRPSNNGNFQTICYRDYNIA